MKLDRDTLSVASPLEPTPPSGRGRTLSATAAFVATLVLLAGSAIRVGVASGSPADPATSAATAAVVSNDSSEAVPTPLPAASPESMPSSEPTPATLDPTPATLDPTPASVEATPASQPPVATPGPDHVISVDAAVDLIWQGEYDSAERALQHHLRDGGGGAARAELLVYLAYIASIRQEPSTSRALLLEALQASPGLALSPVEFPKAMRDLLIEVRREVSESRPRPQRGEFEAKLVLAPEATPLAWKGGSRWYRKWYVWAGLGAAVAIAILTLSDGSDSAATPTATRTPSATATPTGGVFPETESLEFLPCDGADTLHIFEIPAEIPSNIIVTDAELFLEIQGDYDDPGQFVRLSIERQGALTQLGPGQGYCQNFSTVRLGQQLAQQLQVALQNDRRIEIAVRPNTGIIYDHCNRCNPFHRIRLQFSFRRP